MNDTIMYSEWHKHVTDIKLDLTVVHLHGQDTVIMGTIYLNLRI